MVSQRKAPVRSTSPLCPAIVDAWNSKLAEVLALPDLRKKLVELGLEVQTSTPAELAERQVRALVAFTASMKAAGYKPE